MIWVSVFSVLPRISHECGTRCMGERLVQYPQCTLYRGGLQSVTWELTKNAGCGNATPGSLKQKLRGKEHIIKPSNWFEPQLNALGHGGLISFGPWVRKPWNYKMRGSDLLIPWRSEVFLLLYLLTGQETPIRHWLSCICLFLISSLHSALALPSWVVNSEEALVVPEFGAGGGDRRHSHEEDTNKSLLSFCFWKYPVV